MKTIKERLQEADPVRQEPAVSSSRREASRQVVVAEALATARGATRSGFRLVRVAMVSVLVIGILLLGRAMWPQMGFETHAAVRFEVRLAEDMPAPGLREAKVAGSDRIIYLHQEIIVSNGDIARAEVLPDRGAAQFFVGVYFKPDGAQKMGAATQNHIGKPVAILLEDEVVMAPVLRSVIRDSAVISGNFTREQAERIVAGIY